MTAEDNLIKEYELLKGEILNCINLSNRISLFSFTATIAILSFSLTLNPVRPVLCLIPLVVILPLSAKTAYYRKNMLVVSSYLIEKIEPKVEELSWETGVSRFKKEKLENIFLGIRNFEFLFEAVLCVLLYVYMQDSAIFVDIPFWLSVFVCLIVTIICLIQSCRQISIE